MIKFILKYLRKYKLLVFFLTILMFFSLLITSITPYIAGRFIDLIVLKPTKKEILNFGYIFCLIGVMGIVCSYVTNIISMNFTYKVIFKVESDIISHMQKIPYEDFKKNFNPAQLIQRIRNDSDTIITFFINNMYKFTYNIVLISSVLFLMMKISFSIFFIMILFIPIYILIYIILKRPLYNSTVKVKEENTIYFKKIYEDLHQLQEIKIHAHYDKRERKRLIEFIKYNQVLLENLKLVEIFKSIDSILSIIFQVLVLIIGGMEIVKGNLTIGQYTIINVYFGIVLSSINYYFNLGEAYQRARASYFRIKELFDIPEEQNGHVVIQDIKSISVDGIEFIYPGDFFKLDKRGEKIVFEKGNIYSLAGANGTGKSTFINILVGVIQSINKGSIHYNDHNINTLNKVEMRKKRISFLSQQIVYGDETVEEFLLQYIDTDKVSLRNIIRNNNFINSLWNENEIINLLNRKMASLSVGELKKIYLFKTFEKECDILILDEPTASLDKAALDVLKEYLKIYKKEHIIIIVNHEILLNDIFDKIIYFDKKL